MPARRLPKQAAIALARPSRSSSWLPRGLPSGDAVQRLRAEEGVERRDHGEAQRRAGEAGQHGPELRLVRQREKAGEIRGGGDRRRHRPDHPPQARPVAEEGERVVRPGAGDQPGDHRRHPRREPPRLPDHERRAEADREGERLHRGQITADLGRQDVGRRPGQRPELGDQDQEGHRVLESRHHRRGDVLDQGADAERAEQRLEHAGHEDDEKEHGEGLPDAPPAPTGGGRGRDRLQDDRPQQEGQHAPRRVDRRAPVSEHERRQRDEGRGVEAGEDGVGDVLIPERVQREHPVAHADGHTEEGSGGSAHQLTANGRHVRSCAEPALASRRSGAGQGWCGARSVSTTML